MNSVRGTEILEELAALYRRKNTDYAEGGQQGEFGNFKRVADFMKLYPQMDWATPNGVALVYSFKQLDAALMLLSQDKGSVTGEPVHARLRDVAIYSVIGVALAEELTCLREAISPSPVPLSVREAVERANRRANVELPNEGQGKPVDRVAFTPPRH